MIKGVTTLEINFSLRFWHIKGLYTIKHAASCLKHPPHYKQNIYLIKLQKKKKKSSLDIVGSVTSHGQIA